MLHVNKLLVFLLMTFSINSYAFVLNGTRFIYPEANSSISISVRNNSSLLYGGQVWIDNYSTKDDNVYFSVSPSLFRLNGGETQLVRITNVDDRLPQDKESLFIINAQEIPAIRNANDSNNLLFAINTKVKMIYRPDSIKSRRENAENYISASRSAHMTKLKNNTPYYFALIEIYNESGEKIDLSKYGLEDALGTFAPNDIVEIPIPMNLVSLVALNDYGAAKRYDLRVEK